jgi:hypothetical protein
LQRTEQQVTAGALESMKAAYLGVNKGQTEQGFQQHLQTPQGKQTFEAYKRAERNKGRRNPAAFSESNAKDLEHAQRTGGSLTERRTGPIEPDTGMARLGLTPGATVPERGKRPSLDEIFGK